MMIKFVEIFKKIEQEYSNEQRRLSVDSCLNVYYGITIDKHLRIAFISKTKPFEMQSTKEIKVTQGKESEEVYWSCFDLIKEEAKDIFCIFCDSLIEAIENIYDEQLALNSIRERFHSWKLLLKSKGKMPYEYYQGLYGELYFIIKYLSKKIGFENSIKTWCGPDGYSKDFSLEDTWYEVKTIGTSADTIKINSLAQLDSNVDGHLVVIMVERMSDEFDEKLSSVPQLYHFILDNLISRELKENFINKTLKYGYIDDDLTINNYKFEVKDEKKYLVEQTFPKLTRNSIKTNAISHVSYEILISTIEKYEEDFNEF